MRNFLVRPPVLKIEPLGKSRPMLITGVSAKPSNNTDTLREVIETAHYLCSVILSYRRPFNASIGFG